MPTILNYEYAKLATTAYLDTDSLGPRFTGARFAAAANAQECIPLELAERLFDSHLTHSPWTVPTCGYRGNDSTGFAATLSVKRWCKRKGTGDPRHGAGPNPYLDLLKADLHGEYGMVIQAVSLLNDIHQLRARVATRCQVTANSAMSSSNHAVGRLCHVA